MWGHCSRNCRVQKHTLPSEGTHHHITTKPSEHFHSIHLPTTALDKCCYPRTLSTGELDEIVSLMNCLGAGSTHIPLLGEPPSPFQTCPGWSVGRSFKNLLTTCYDMTLSLDFFCFQRIIFTRKKPCDELSWSWNHLWTIGWGPSQTRYLLPLLPASPPKRSTTFDVSQALVIPILPFYFFHTLSPVSLSKYFFFKLAHFFSLKFILKEKFWPVP